MAEVMGGMASFSGRGDSGSEDSPVASSVPLAKVEKHPQWPVLARLPLKMIVSVPIGNFKVRDLLVLEPGQMIRSSWKTSDDVPATIAAVMLAVCEFEVVDQHLAVRLTRLVTL